MTGPFFNLPAGGIRMTTYNWDLIERLLHEVQNGEGSFAPRKYAEQEGR